jgi:hypothetical protein
VLEVVEVLQTMLLVVVLYLGMIIRMAVVAEVEVFLSL